LGPDLSRIGMRVAAFLRDSIVDPDKEVNFNYLAANVTTTSGEKIRGVFLNEDEYSIQLRDMKGNPRSFLKQNLRDFQHEKVSLMPASPRLAGADLDNLVAYLSSLRAGSYQGAR
jgi:putative heme-binding domain-containing protein